MDFENFFTLFKDAHIGFISYDKSPKSHQRLSFNLSHSFSSEGVVFPNFLKRDFFSSIKTKFFHQNELFLVFTIGKDIFEVGAFKIYGDFFIIHFHIEVHRIVKVRIKTGILNMFLALYLNSIRMWIIMSSIFLLKNGEWRIKVLTIKKSDFLTFFLF